MSDLEPTTEVRRQWAEGEREAYWLFVQMEERDDEITRLQADNETLRARVAELEMVLRDAQAIIESDANTEENYGSLCRIGSVLKSAHPADSGQGE